LSYSDLHGDSYVKGELFSANAHMFVHPNRDGMFMVLRTLASWRMYMRGNGTKTFKTMAQNLAGFLIDLESPIGINSAVRYGPLYKTSRDILSMYIIFEKRAMSAGVMPFCIGVDYDVSV
jgi:hypothetical protein